jgi:hypothetical protein
VYVAGISAVGSGIEQNLGNEYEHNFVVTCSAYIRACNFKIIQSLKYSFNQTTFKIPPKPNSPHRVDISLARSFIKLPGPNASTAFRAKVLRIKSKPMMHDSCWYLEISKIDEACDEACARCESLDSGEIRWRV